MSFATKAKDYTPFIPAAGNSTEASVGGVTADLSIRPDLYFKQTTSTPDEIKKYRDSTRQRVGVKQLHPGIYDDPKDYEDWVHGVKTLNSDHVPDCIQNKDDNGNKHFMNQLAESHYASSKREPLGRSIVRNYKFPDEISKNPEFKFGVPTKGIMNAKDLIYNGAPLEEAPEVKKLYNRSHGLTDPGEQQKRDYKWKFDPNAHLFGYGKELEQDGVKKSLMTDNLTNPYPQTKIVGKRLEDFRQRNADLLGTGKYFGTLNPKYQGEDHTFGKECELGDEWNAGRCIHGDETTVTNDSMKPDVDLGRSHKYANKLKSLQPPERDMNRAYGLPSIRNDLANKELKSVTDFTNYGDEPDAYELLYPHPEHFRGVNDPEFEELMTKEEIFEILKKYNFDIPIEEFDLIYEVGLKNFPNEEGKMSSRNFVSTMRNLKREYQKYSAVFNTNC